VLVSERADDGPDRSAALRALQFVTPGPVRRSFVLKFGIVLLVMALSVGLIGLLATQAITAQTEESVEDEFRTLASQEASLVEQWVDQNERTVELLAGSEAFEGGDHDAALQSVAGQTADDVEALHVVQTDGTGLTVVSTHETGGGLDAEDEREWFDDAATELQGLDEGEVYRSDTYEIGDERYVGFLTPLAADDDHALFIEVTIAELEAALAGAGEGTESFTQVVSEETELVMLDGLGESQSTVPYATADDALDPVSLGAELRDGPDESGLAELRSDEDVIDEPYVVGYAPVDGTDWVVLTHEPRSSAFGVVDSLSTWGVLLTLLAVSLIAVTGSALGYSNARSINTLTRQTQEMREGNLDVELATSREDEIGQLAEGLDAMRTDLKERIDEAERARDGSQSARKEAEVARAEAETMVSYLQEKAEEYSEIMQEVGMGDLTCRLSADGEEESMDRIAGEFNEMISELEKTTGQLKRYVDEVEESGAEVERSAETVRDASEQIANSIQKISDDAYDQKERLRGVSETLEDVTDELDATGADDAVESLEAVSAELGDITELSEETMTESEHVAGAAEEQAAELYEVSERANDLQRYAQPLRDILERFETEAEHEFVFSVGPTGGLERPGASPGEDEL